MAITPRVPSVASPLWQEAVGAWELGSPRVRPVPLAVGLVALAHVAGAWWMVHRPEDIAVLREPQVLTVSLLAAPTAPLALPRQEPVVPEAQPRAAAPNSPQPRSGSSTLPSATPAPLATASPSVAPAVSAAPVAQALPAVSTVQAATAMPSAATAVGAEPVRSQPQPKVLPASAVRYLVEPVLTYPRASQDLGESGTVVLKVLVDELGRPKEVEVAKSSGHARLDQQAMQAMRRARFQPHIEDGAARPVWVMAPQTFTLEDQ